MKLYTRVKEIPGCDDVIVGTKKDWTSVFDGMNLQFDYMLDRNYIREDEIDIPSAIYSLDLRLRAIEDLLKKK